MPSARSPSWPIARTNRRSRELSPRGNTCFGTSGLQALLHLPRFFNRILSHNTQQADGTIGFPCRSTRMLQREIQEMSMMTGWDTKPGVKPVPLRHCPACALKRVAQRYWSKVDLSADGRPTAFCHSQVDLRRIERIDMALAQYTPGAADEDQEEFQTRYLKACRESVDHT